MGGKGQLAISVATVYVVDSQNACWQLLTYLLFKLKGITIAADWA